MDFLISIIFFLATSLVFFTFFGISLLSFTKYKFTSSEQGIFGTITGFVFVTIFSYFSFLLGIPLLALLFPLSVIWISRRSLLEYKNELLQKLLSFSPKQYYLLLFIFLIGITAQLAIIAPSGLKVGGNLLFWSANGHDGTWHIALMELIKKGGVLKNPVFSGERLVNYHFFSDVAPALYSYFLPFFNNFDLYFRLFPFLYSLLLGASSYLLVKKMTNSKSASLWAVFFTYFAGSFGFIATYFKDGKIGGESIFWATQIQSSSGNPPQIISNFLVLTYLYFILILFKKNNWRLLSLVSIILAAVFLFKVYAALALIIPTLAVGVWQFLKERKLYIFLLGIIGGIIGSIFYLPNVTFGTSFLIFEPWWYIRTMIVEPSRLNWLDHELRRQTYVYENNWKRVIFLELQGLTIFILGNLGMRIIGFWDFFKSAHSSYKNHFNLLLVLIIILSVVFPLIFLQRGVASNTSQFLQYFILLFGILAGISTNKIIGTLRVAPLKVGAGVLIIILAIPTQIGLLQEFYSRPAFAKISQYEIEALEFVKKSTHNQSVILTPPYNPWLNLGDSTPHIWDWFDTSYVSAISARSTYFDDYEQVDIMGYDFEARKKDKEIIFNSLDETEIKKALSKIKPDIIYFPKIIEPKIPLHAPEFQKIYENSEVEIWEKIIRG